MYDTRNVVVATEFKRRMKGGRKVHGESSVEISEHAAFIQHGSIRESGLHYSEWLDRPSISGQGITPTI